MRHGSLFSGIGGFDLAAQWMGWENVFHCEWNPFCQKVLKYHWPDAVSYGDITQTDFTIWRGRIDILTGGFPCQPYSHAGKRKGTEDDRHLWPEMLRAIREIKPTWIVGENVPGIISWNNGLVFEQVCAELEAEGYEVQPIVLPACGVDAPHRRDRIWFVAYNTGERCGEARECIDRSEKWNSGHGNEWITENTVSVRRGSNKSKSEPGKRRQRKYGAGDYVRLSDVTYNNGQHGNISGLCTGKTPQQQASGIRQNNITDTDKRRLQRITEKTKGQFAINGNTWNIFPTQSPLCSGNDGISSRLAGITLSKHRTESIKGYGNAVVPQVVYQIFKAIEFFSKDT